MIKEIINHTLFTIAGDVPVLLIDLVTSIFGLTCVFLAGRNSKYNFWVGYFYTALLFLMFWNKNLYASLILQPISLGINILGHYRWTHPKKGEESSSDPKSLKVTMLSRRQRIITIASVFILAILWGWLLRQLGTRWFVGVFPSDPIPYLDAFVTVLILVAQFLSAQEMGLLDCLALCQHHSDSASYLSGSHLYADSECSLPYQWSGFALSLV